ncbi:MAG: PqqD family protein [bacterium]
MITDRSNQLPKARQERLIVKELPDEVLVYDLERDKAHCLNNTAALVWKSCDGKRTVRRLRELVEENAGAPVPEEMIWLALDQLEEFKLLDEAPLKPVRFAGMTRRDMVRRVGLAAITLPVILSIVAPAAAQAASGLAPNACCGNPTQCASNNCNQSPTCVGIPGPSTKACA